MSRIKDARLLRIVLCGALGRMGCRITSLAENDPRLRIVVGVDRDPTSRSVSLAPFSVIPMRGLMARAAASDVFVDFSTPAASIGFARIAVQFRKPLIIGTTGFNPRQFTVLRAASRKIPVFLSPNFSVGMNLLFRLASQAAAALSDYDAGILEIHHTRKKDAPSGSSLLLAQAVRRGNPDATAPIVSQRLGAVVGDHVLTLAGPHERLELAHRVQSRDAFARGALDAALWIRGKRPGLYDMQDLLSC